MKKQCWTNRLGFSCTVEWGPPVHGTVPSCFGSRPSRSHRTHRGARRNSVPAARLQSRSVSAGMNPQTRRLHRACRNPAGCTASRGSCDSLGRCWWLRRPCERQACACGRIWRICTAWNPGTRWPHASCASWVRGDPDATSPAWWSGAGRAVWVAHGLSCSTASAGTETGSRRATRRTPPHGRAAQAESR